MVIGNKDDESDEVMIVGVRPKDHSGLTILVSVKGESVAEIQMTEKNDVLNNAGLDRSV